MPISNGTWDGAEYPELITMAAEHSDVTPADVVAAIRMTLELLSNRPNAEERKEIYAKWLEPISGPLAEALAMPIETVHLALVAQVQTMDDAIPTGKAKR